MARSRDRASRKKGVFRYVFGSGRISSRPGLSRTGPNTDPGDGKTPCLSIDKLVETRTPQETLPDPQESRNETGNKGEKSSLREAFPSVSPVRRWSFVFTRLIPNGRPLRGRGAHRSRCAVPQGLAVAANTPRSPRIHP